MRYRSGFWYTVRAGGAGECGNGEIIARHVAEYAHPLTEDSLVDGADYDAALEELLLAMSRSGHEIAGIAVDATALTLVPVGADGRLLSGSMPDETHARVKLWKRHTAEKYALRAAELAREHAEPFLMNTGGEMSSEWTIPKLLETCCEAPRVWENMDLALDLCDYLTWRLTGRLTRSVASLCYKSCWTYENGFPGDAYLNALHAGFAEKFRCLMRGDVLMPGEKAGYLAPGWREKLGIIGDVAVAAGQPDGNTPPVAMGAVHDGDVSLTVGTSMVMLVNTAQVNARDGVIGIAPGGIAPGCTAVEFGQNCTGELLGWYVDNMLPASYACEAERQGISPHELLSGRIESPWTNRAVACNWWNGSRCAPTDLMLTGAITGLTLATRPEDIYLTFMQSLAVNTREMLELCRKNGAEPRRIFAAGGAARKNPMFMQQMADITDMPVRLTGNDEAGAFGSAVLAAVAAGIYPDISAACGSMCMDEFIVFEPDMEHRDDYEKLYARCREVRRGMAELQRRQNET